MEQAKLPAVVSATPAVVQMERAWRATTAHAHTASSIAKLRSRCVYLEPAVVQMECATTAHAHCIQHCKITFTLRLFGIGTRRDRDIYIYI